MRCPIGNYPVRFPSFLIAVAALLLALNAACASRASEPGPNPKLSVVTSIYPMEYFTKRVGGGAVDVVNLVPPGVEAHSFEPTPRDVERLADADVVVMNGLELEPWLERSLRALGSRAPSVVIEAADLAHIQTLSADGRRDEGGHDHDDGHGHGGEHDPHVWLDPLLAIAQAERIRDTLLDLAPEHAAELQANAQALIQELKALHGAFGSTLASCRHNHFVTAHAAYAYLAARYDLEQVSIGGLTPEAEPSAQRLAQISDQVRVLGLRYILVEPVLGTRLADTVRRETGVELLSIHQIESVTPAELDEYTDYMGLMENNLRHLATALECES